MTQTQSQRPTAGRVRRLATAGRELLTRRDTAGVARRDAALALVIRVGNAGLAYLAQAVLARLMGQFEYGLFAYTWVWFMVFSAVATLGFGDSPIRFIAQLRERGEAAHVRGFIRFAALVILATSVAFGSALIVAMPRLTAVIEPAYLLPMSLMAICLPFACLQSFLEGVGRSYGWMLPALLPIYILRHGLLLGFMVAAVAAGVEPTAANGFICLIAVLVMSLLYQGIDIVLRLRKVLEPVAPSYRPREWVRGSAPFAVLYGAQHLSSFADVLVLSFFVSPAEIAVYFAATRIIQVVNLIPYAATVGTAHLFAASHTRGDHAEMQRLCSHVAATTVVISAAAIGGILLAGPWLLGMFGHGFEAGYPPLAILAVGVMARVLAGPAEDVLNMTGNGGLSASTYLAIVILNVVLAVALVIPFGIVGAAAASAFTMAVRGLWLSLAARRRLGIKTSVLATVPYRRLFRPSLRIASPGVRSPAE